MRIFYYLSSCNTCKRIAKELKLDNTILQIDVKKNPLSLSEIETLRDALNVKVNNNINRNYNNKLRNYYILDSNNYIPCPSNENPTSFFRKTGFNCYDLNQNTITEQNIDSNDSLKIRTIIDYK